ncbi:thiol-disulfide isomerase/thioredoxin [Gracilibacillus halotolerans]|uniref:Thiol-disulfide isomerase/thioredoxin n=1 Tax=Gracilibacillus halotolerans TaxID=74386 RepID=A0A841RL87_9BACI|nr:thioredoxin family protein [Gracilibacillus halotolerans]MBB6513249.1 thiol-disulfide isomerase/thioredoxin [Gracilibacillus halotolerans]
MASITIQTTEQLDNWLRNNKLALLYISKNGCSVCHSLYPQIEDILNEFPMISFGYTVVDDFPQIAGRFLVFTAPVILLFVDGEEYLREARIVHLNQFYEKLKKVTESI